jgi:hypothetical protein
MDNGFIKLHRKLIEWEWFADSKTFHVFMYLLLDANHTEKKWRGITVERGQTLTGRIKISEATGVSQQSVRTALSNLCSTDEITIQSTNRFSIITICNYDKYQSLVNSTNQPDNQQLTNSQPATNQQPTTNKNEKKDLKPKVKRFVPPTIEEIKAYCQDRNNSVDPERFFHHYQANGWVQGKGKPVKNWKSCIITWEKNNISTDNGKPKQMKDRIVDGFRAKGEGNGNLLDFTINGEEPVSAENATIRLLPTT